MLKLSASIALLIGACAVNPNISDTEQHGTVCDGSGNGSCECPPPPGPTCTTKKEGTVSLDDQPANLDHSDNKVTFCHATGSETNPFILITTSVEGCINGHEGHEPGGNSDIFPTQGCAD
jgi:hypothetical protein